MLNGKGFEILIASPPNYDNLVAEIYFDGLFFALISQEKGPGVFEFETAGPDVIEQQVCRKVTLDELQEAIETAQKQLSNERLLNPNNE